jgi:hypothetical protein
VSDFPHYLRYVERLSPDSPTADVELPQSRSDAFDWLETINRLATEDPLSWKATVRQATSCDWYMLALFMSGSQRVDPFTGRPELDCDFQFTFAREMQFDGDRVLDKSFRGSWKSTWRNYVGITNVVINDPNIVAVIAAHEKAAAQRHVVRTMQEWESNVELRTAWADVFYDDVKLSPLWNQESGCTVKRTLPSTLPTLSAHSILSAPTGSRVGLFVLDDVESEATVESAEMREKTLKRIASFLETAGRVPRIWINATAHHAQGVVTHLESSGSFRVRCHKLEDTDQEPPDIAALYDACGGVLPLRDEARHEVLPKGVRDVRLDGMPVYLHPLEVAQKRLDAMSVPGGLEHYFAQNLGDAWSGQQRRLDKGWILYYQADPIDQARGGYGYVCIDPSKGVNDPTVVRLEVTKADRTISWVACLRKKLAPSEFGREILAFLSLWEKVVDIREIRVEEFGQSTWGWILRDYFDRHDQPIARVITCNRHSTDNKESRGRQREWLGLEPLYKSGKRRYPEGGLWIEDDNSKRSGKAARLYDVCEYYLENEYGPFPMPKTDDLLAADYLLTVTKAKNERGEMIDIQLDYPETDEEAERQARGEWRMRRATLGADADSTAWMNETW